MEQLIRQLTDFAQDQWYILAGAGVLLLIVVNVVKTMVKWALVAVIALGVLFYGANYQDALKDEVFSAMIGESETAQYSEQADGTFTVTSKSLTIEGKKGSDEVTVYYEIAGKSFKLTSFSLTDEMTKFIEAAKANVKV